MVGLDVNDADLDPSAGPMDGHGTRVLGVAVARGNNEIGISGVCPECLALPVRLFTSGKDFAQKFDQLYGEMSVAAEAMLWAADHGARVINNSWGPIIDPYNPKYSGLPQIVEDAITALARRGDTPGAGGVLIVWAAGNNTGQVASFDAWVSDPRVMAIGAINAADVLAKHPSAPRLFLSVPRCRTGAACSPTPPYCFRAASLHIVHDTPITPSAVAKIPIAGAVPGDFVQPDDCNTAPALEVCVCFP